MSESERPVNLREARLRIRSQARFLGLLIKQRGSAWRVYGPGVDILVADLATLQRADLMRVLRKAG